MNSRPLQPSILPSLSLTERVVSGVGKALRTARVLRVLWRDSRARRRARRTLSVPSRDMNAHMLRDIGAHDQVIAHAAARKDADHRRRIAFQLSTPLLVVTLIATATLGAGAEAADSRPTGTAPATAQLIGTFTGEYVSGAPVYRLPPVIVVGSRKVERVKLEREDQSTRASQARSKAAARPPA